MSKIFSYGIVFIVLFAGVFWYVSSRQSPLETEIKNIQTTGTVSESLGKVVEGDKDGAGEKTNTGTISKTDNKQNNKMKATLHTNKGDITIEFNEGTTPNTVANFIKLAKDGFYDGVKFHRVIKGFMIQGGDPLTKDDTLEARWGTGGPGYAFNDEITPSNKNNIGTIAMANSGPNTNGSQFFINVNNNNFLDTKHTVFGHVVSGMETVTAIENTPTNSADRPLEAVVIKSVTVE